ncbi:hypothetical protein B0H14DRAFT_3453517 [Mycena olivaceomarginata]|nr:hypothetical protein B0H14DRAFT_3453517 [Mycena olivaceomarginata]
MAIFSADDAAPTRAGPAVLDFLGSGDEDAHCNWVYELRVTSYGLFTHPLILTKPMDSFTTTAKKIEDVVLPPINEDGGTGSSGSCVVCKEDGSLPTINEDGGTGSSGSCVIA